VPDASRLATSQGRATSTVEGFYALLGKGDVRLCRLLDVRAANTFARSFGARTCAEAVGGLSADQRGEVAAQVRDITVLDARATSALRVEVDVAKRRDGEPLVVEVADGRWQITSFG